MAKEAWTLNGYWISPDPKQLYGTIVECIPDVQYWSTEALSQLYLGMIEMSKEMAQDIWENKSVGYRKMSRFLKSCNNKIKNAPTNREFLINNIYELVLSGEGMSRLHGFGISNRFGDFMYGNPEVKSLRSID